MSKKPHLTSHKKRIILVLLEVPVGITSAGAFQGMYLTTHDSLFLWLAGITLFLVLTLMVTVLLTIRKDKAKETSR